MNKPGILIVDDERSVLSSLKRLFRQENYQVYTAESGQLGLDILSENQVDLIISDMRMPEMDGAQFLEQVTHHYPTTIRFLLTGFSDLESTIAAINKGKIHNYLSKPWDDNHLKLTVSEALEKLALKKENERLNKLTQEQNQELKQLNNSLEQKVEERTAELQLAHKQLEASYRAAIPVFATLIELKETQFSGHCRQVADLAMKIATAAELKPSEIDDIYHAALLHNIGKLGIPDQITQKPYIQLNKTEQKQIHKHPIMAETLLMGLESMTNSSLIIRHQRESYDGTGYPDKLSGNKIPLGSRILLVAIDYFELQDGKLLNKKLSKQEALNFMDNKVGKRYDRQMVDCLLACMDAKEKVSDQEVEFTSIQAKAGMLLSRDLITHDGILLLTKGAKLTEKVIGRIQKLEKETKSKVTFFIREVQKD